MTFADLLYGLMEFILNNLIHPIEDFLFDYTNNAFDDISLNFGFGQITWLSTNLRVVLCLVIGLMVSITALVLTWKFVKMLSNVVRRLFGGVKR